MTIHVNIKKPKDDDVFNIETLPYLLTDEVLKKHNKQFFFWLVIAIISSLCIWIAIYLLYFKNNIALVFWISLWVFLFLIAWISKIFHPDKKLLKKQYREILINYVKTYLPNIPPELHIITLWTTPSLSYTNLAFKDFNKALTSKDERERIEMNLGSNFNPHNINALICLYHELGHLEQIREKKQFYTFLKILRFPLFIVSLIWFISIGLYFYISKANITQEALHLWLDISTQWSDFLISTSSMIINWLSFFFILWTLCYWIIDVYVEWDATKRAKEQIYNLKLKNLSEKLLSQHLNHTHLVLVSSYIQLYFLVFIIASFVFMVIQAI